MWNGWNQCSNITSGSSCSGTAYTCSSSYTVVSGDAGHTIDAVVKATNGSGNDTAAAPIVPLVDEFVGSSVNPNLWQIVNGNGDTSNSEPQCNLSSQNTVSGGLLTETAAYQSSAFTCPASTPVALLSSSLSTGSPITHLSLSNQGAGTYTIAAGTVTVSSGTHSQAFTTSGGSSSGSLTVSSQTPNFAYPSGSQVVAPITTHYQSGTIAESTAFTYGTVVVRAQVAGGSNTWPAIWMLGSACQPYLSLANFNCNWASDSASAAEIDIEEWGNTTTPGCNIYNDSGSVNHQATMPCRTCQRTIMCMSLTGHPGRLSGRLTARRSAHADSPAPACRPIPCF